MEIWVSEIDTAATTTTAAAPFRSRMSADMSSSTTTTKACCSNPHVTIFVKHGKKWMIAWFFVFFHIVLTFGTYVPTWTSEWGHNETSAPHEIAVLLAQPFDIICNTRGSHNTPECSAQGYYDRLLFGQNHLGTWMSHRLPEVCCVVFVLI